MCYHYFIFLNFRWSYLLFQIANYYVNPPKGQSLWDIVKYTVGIFQNAAFIEVSIEFLITFSNENLYLMVSHYKNVSYTFFLEKNNK